MLITDNNGVGKKALKSKRKGNKNGAKQKNFFMRGIKLG
jgi:hypothetical protein